MKYEEAVLLFYRRTIKVNIKHDLKMLVPALTVSPGIKIINIFQIYFAPSFKKKNNYNACLKTMSKVIR